MKLNLPENIEVRNNLPLSKYSSLKIGGSADLAIFPDNSDQLVCAINELTSQNIRFDIIGNASNILFDDKGYRGALIFTKNMKGVTLERTEGGALLHVGSGKKLTELALETIKRECLSGLEFAYGIPGSIGGAVYMNAGAYGGEMKDIVLSSVCYNVKDKALVALSKDEHGFGYRKSILQESKHLILLSTCIMLRDDNGTALQSARENMESRKQKQPLELPNAGSAFKRPEGYIAAKLIDECGLKGLTVGGAQVSQKHAGFFVNIGGATSADMLELFAIVKERVYGAYGVELEPEIIYLPEN